MSPEVTREEIMLTFAADVLRFASSQSSESLAKIIGFFHLAARAKAAIDFDVQATGLVVFHAEVFIEPRLG